MQAKQSWLGEQAFGEDADALVTVSYKSHQDALLFLRSVLSDDRSVGLLQGPKSSGKTTIVRRLSELLPSTAAVALVDGTGIEPREFLSQMLTKFGYDTGLDDPDELQQMVNVVAVQQTRSNEPPVLIVDNVDRMYPSTLRILNALAEVTVHRRFAIRIIVTGCEGSSSIINYEGMDNIAKRNVGNFVISPLSAREALVYLHAKLVAYGVNSADTVFPVDVCDRLHQLSGGWPGLMNQFAIEAIERAADFPLSVADTYLHYDVEGEGEADVPVTVAKKKSGRLPPRLIVTSNGKTVSEYVFTQAKVLIGRSGFADIVIDDTFVSKLHAVMLLYSDALVLFDLSSANGITVNSVKIKSTILRENDIILLGNHRLKVMNAPAISDEMASLLETNDTVEMKNLIEMRRLRARRHALVTAQRHNQG